MFQFIINKKTMTTNNFGFAKNQNISTFSYPTNLSDISNLYNLSIPQRLPEVRLRKDNDDDDYDDDEDDDDNIVFITKTGVIDRDWVSHTLSQLQNLFHQIPRYGIPPLINFLVDNDNEDSKNMNEYIDDIINKSSNNNNFGSYLFSGKQQQKQRKPSSTI